MRRKAVSGIMLSLLLMSMLTLALNIQPARSEPSTIIVPDDYEKIQWAIGNASNGDIIFVRAGTYYENVFVNKTVSLIGENKNTTIIDGAGTTIIDSFLFDGGLFVFADDVKIANFTVRNGSYGINIRGDHISGNRVTVTDCVAYNNWFGLKMFQSSQNLLRRNLLFNNSYNLHIGEFWHINEFLHDIDTSNLVNGKPVYYLANKKNLSINPVSFPNIGYLGVVNSTNVRISNFSISRNGEGLLIAFSSDTLIERIEATNNFNGISLSESLRTTIRHCNFSYNYEGIFAYYSDYVIIEENTVSHNDQGIFLMGSNYGTVHHNNFVENGLSPGLCQARAYQSYNYDWDNGYPSGGNYWSDHVTVDDYSGINQDEPGSDGIVDEPYTIDDYNQDNYPLMEHWAPLPLIPTTLFELKTKVEELGSEGEIDNKGIVKSLIAKLNVAQKLVDKGKIDEAKSILEDDFIPQVQNLSRIHITPEAGDILIQSAEYILSHL
ncbi:MAG: right-handed parallel beta-helix repeat-containing protein [Candidatus Hodarchaeota archaeon]